jgi:hypothetical protein
VLPYCPSVCWWISLAPPGCTGCVHYFGTSSSSSLLLLLLLERVIWSLSIRQLRIPDCMNSSLPSQPELCSGNNGGIFTSSQVAAGGDVNPMHLGMHLPTQFQVEFLRLSLSPLYQVLNAACHPTSKKMQVTPCPTAYSSLLGCVFFISYGTYTAMLAWVGPLCSCCRVIGIDPKYSSELQPS